MAQKHSILSVCLTGVTVAAALLCSAAMSGGAEAAADCAGVTADPTKLGVSRILAVDGTKGPILGKMTRLPHEPVFLGPKEVVLTFDDGPLPWITRSILDTLDRHCTRATFFSIGKMAVAYPGVVREELDRGHSVGTHTWSHPLNLKRLKPEAAVDEMERGFAAVSAAAGRPIAAFFRFPGLSDSPALIGHLAERHVAAFTVDVVSNDSFIHDPARLTRETLAKVEANHGGIILFHDIKATTAKALPGILDALAAQGYSVVHLVSKHALIPQPGLAAGFDAQVARLMTDKGKTRQALVPFFGTTGPVRAEVAPEPEPVPRAATLSARDATREDTVLDDEAVVIGEEEVVQPRGRRLGNRQTGVSAWTTSVRRTLQP